MQDYLKNASVKILASFLWATSIHISLVCSIPTRVRGNTTPNRNLCSGQNQNKRTGRKSKSALPVQFCRYSGSFRLAQYCLNQDFSLRE